MALLLCCCSRYDLVVWRTESTKRRGRWAPPPCCLVEIRSNKGNLACCTLESHHGTNSPRVVRWSLHTVPRLPTALLPQIACGVSPFAISSRSTPPAPPHDTRVHPACTPRARSDVRDSSWLGFGSLLVHQVAASNESVSQEPLGCNTQLHTAAAGTCCWCLKMRTNQQSM